MQSLTVRPSTVRIGLALGGGFARGIAHAGLLRAFQRHRIPIHCVAGVSAGAVVAAAYASGTTADEIAAVGRSMRFSDVGRWRPGRLGLVSSAAMIGFLGRLVKTDRFESMRLPLGVLATDLSTGEPVVFSTAGSVIDPVRASCAYPGLFQPVQSQGRLLVDGAISMGVPAALARQLGATHVISVTLPPGAPAGRPSNLFQVVGRCLQILQQRADDRWKAESDLVLAPDVGEVDWHRFDQAQQLIEAGDRAATAAVPEIRRWLAIGRPMAA
jgi:NTE family protein